MNTTDAAQIIQYTLTPAVMISSAALFLLGVQNKFSNLLSRFRALNHEKRTLSHNTDLDEVKHKRLCSIETQLERLLKRVYFVKNAILLGYLSILCFILTSVSLYLDHYTRFSIKSVAVSIFLVGLCSFFFASVLIILETSFAFKIIQLERKT